MLSMLLAAELPATAAEPNEFTPDWITTFDMLNSAL